VLSGRNNISVDGNRENLKGDSQLSEKDLANAKKLESQ